MEHHFLDVGSAVAVAAIDLYHSTSVLVTALIIIIEYLVPVYLSLLYYYRVCFCFTCLYKIRLLLLILSCKCSYNRHAKKLTNRQTDRCSDRHANNSQTDRKTNVKKTDGRPVAESSCSTRWYGTSFRARPNNSWAQPRGHWHTIVYSLKKVQFSLIEKARIVHQRYAPHSMFGHV